MTRLPLCSRYLLSKKSYRSPAAAEKARVLISSGNLAGTRLYVFECRFCGFWHLSRSERPHGKAA